MFAFNTQQVLSVVLNIPLRNYKAKYKIFFYLCQFGFVDVDMLQLPLTVRHTGSQTSTCEK